MIWAYRKYHHQWTSISNGEKQMRVVSVGPSTVYGMENGCLFDSTLKIHVLVFYRDRAKVSQNDFAFQLIITSYRY